MMGEYMCMWHPSGSHNYEINYKKISPNYEIVTRGKGSIFYFVNAMRFCISQTLRQFTIIWFVERRGDVLSCFVLINQQWLTHRSGFFSSILRTFLGNFLPGMRRVHEGSVLDLVVDIFIFIKRERPTETAEHTKHWILHEIQDFYYRLTCCWEPPENVNKRKKIKTTTTGEK